MNRLKYVSFSVLILLYLNSPAQDINKKLTSQSRSSCVKITSNGISLGSGFFIRDDLVVTCFHVIAQIQVNEGKVNYQIFGNLIAIDENGNSIPIECISNPTDKSPEPLIHDFAVLKVEGKLSGYPENIILSDISIC